MPRGSDPSSLMRVLCFPTNGFVVSIPTALARPIGLNGSPAKRRKKPLGSGSGADVIGFPNLRSVSISARPWLWQAPCIRQNLPGNGSTNFRRINFSPDASRWGRKNLYPLIEHRCPSR
jgi:hypothetical protein